MTPRSYLYVPGHRQDMLHKASATDADALIADLEDGVPPAEKDAARSVVASWLREERDSTQQQWVRVEGTESALPGDLEACLQPALHGIYLPKADLSTVHVMVPVPEQHISRLRTGGTASVHFICASI